MQLHARLCFLICQLWGWCVLTLLWRHWALWSLDLYNIAGNRLQSDVCKLLGHDEKGMIQKEVNLTFGINTTLYLSFHFGPIFTDLSPLMQYTHCSLQLISCCNQGWSGGNHAFSLSLECFCFLVLKEKLLLQCMRQVCNALHLILCKMGNRKGNFSDPFWDHCRDSAACRA